MLKIRLVIAIWLVTLSTSIVLAQLPDYFDWRDVDGENWMTPVKNQGACGSCWAFSAVGAVEGQYNIFFDWPQYDPDLSEQYLVSDCFPSWDCGGGWHYDALDFIRDSGITDEACFPYIASNSPCNRCDDWDIRLWKIDDKEHVSNTVEAIKNYIYNVGPLSVCLDWGNGDFDEDGIWRCDPDFWYHHCVVVSGYNDPGGYWIAKNSWGVDWNGDGYFKVGFGECLIQNLAYGATLNNPDIDKFYVENSAGETVGWFGDSGNLVLKGTLEQSSNHTATANDEFRVQDSAGEDVAIIDATTGNMYIDGTLKLDSEGNWVAPTDGDDNFRIQDSGGNDVAYISKTGDLYLKGKLYENPEQ